MSRQVSLTSCLAKMYESNLDSAGGAGKSPSRSSAAGGSNLSSLDKKLNLLNDKVDKLLNFQEDVMEKLGTVHQGIDDLEKGIDKLKVISMPDNLRREAEGGLNNADGNMDGVCTEILRLVKNVHHDTLKQGERLLGVEKMVSAVDKAIVFIGETFKNSTVVDFILKGIVPWKKGSLSEVPDEIKDKPEVKGTRPKNALSSRGVQVDVRRAVEEPKTGKKLDGNNGKCEQVDWRTTEVSDADSGPPPEKKQPDPQMVRPPEGTSSPRDAHGKASKKDRDPPGDPDPSGRQNPAAHEEAKPRRAASEGSPGKAAPAPGTSFPHAASSASSPRAPKADCHPLLPRFSSTAPKADARETISTTSVKSQDNMVGECTKEKGPLRLRAEAQEDGRCQEKLKHSKCHKDSRTDPQTEEKEARSEGKQDPQVLKEGKLQTHFCKPSVEKVVKEKADHKCKALTHLSSSDRDRRSEAAGPGQSLQEPPEATKLLAKDSGHQKPQSETPLTDRMENETSQCVAQGQAVDNSTASGTDALVIDDSPPPPAPFVHRIVSVKPAPLTTCYAICQHEVLGGGRFGQVHKCTEVSSGLSLAAKIIK
ncbi:myosin light chain kinase 3-like isoform X1 [Rhinatrema bivittatum]|nr:myosin light chain kinase 3-like isoform X1 [Rhinatrema bivittatum]